jgi:hypothetical protein
VCSTFLLAAVVLCACERSVLDFDALRFACVTR